MRRELHGGALRLRARRRLPRARRAPGGRDRGRAPALASRHDPRRSPEARQRSRTSGTKRTSSSSARSRPRGGAPDQRPGAGARRRRAPPAGRRARAAPRASASAASVPAAATLIASKGAARAGRACRRRRRGRRPRSPPRAGVLGVARQALLALDRPHPRGERAQHGGVIARAGADVEHTVLAAQLEQLGHPRDDQRLGDRLPAADAQRAVVPGRPRAAGGTNSRAGRRRSPSSTRSSAT